MGVIARNASSNVVAMVVRMAITFIMTPLFVRYLGNFDYGIWEITVAVFGYLGLLDGGLRQAIIVYGARYAKAKSEERLGVLYYTSLRVFAFLGVIAALIWLIWSFNWFEADDGFNDQKYRLFAIIIALQCIISFPSIVPRSILEAQQLYTKTNPVMIGLTVATSCILYVVLDTHNALVMIVAINVVAQLLKLAIFHRLATTAPYVQPMLVSRFSLVELRKLYRFGVKSFVQGAAVQIEASLPAIMIGSIIGPAAIVFYVIPNALFVHTQNVIRSIAEVFLPVFSRLHEAGNVEEQRRIHETGSRALIALALLFIFGLGMLGPEFIGFWIGPEYGPANTDLIRVLAAYYGISLLNPFVVRYLTAIDRHRILATVRPIKVIALIGLASFMLIKYGAIGLAIACLITELIVFPILLFHTCRNLGISMIYYAKAYLAPLIIPVVFLVTLIYFIKKSWVLQTIVDILTVGLLAGAVYFISIFVLALSKNEKSQAISWANQRLQTWRN